MADNNDEIVIPDLDPVTSIQDSDVIMITHSDGTTEKIAMSDFIANVVQDGNKKPASSQAVARNNVHAIRDYLSSDANNPIDVLSVIGSYGDLISSMSEEIKVRIGSYVINSPYGAGVKNCDIFYTIKKISVSNNNWIRVIAYDIRSNQMWENAKRNGT